MKNFRSILSGAWGLLAFWHLFYMLPDSTGVVTFMSTTGFFLSTWIGVMLISKHPWSIWAISLSCVVIGLFALPFAFVLLLPGLLPLGLILATLVFIWNKTSLEELRPAADARSAVLSFAGVFFGVAVAAGVLGFVVFDGKNVIESFNKSKLESRCADPKVDINDCRAWALSQANRPRDEKEMIAGNALLKELCRGGNPASCRLEIMTRFSWQFDKMTYRDLSKELLDRCEVEGGVACLASALEMCDGVSGCAVVADMARSKCSKTDLDACVAWAITSGDDTNEAHTKSCELGILGSCSYPGVPTEVRLKVCAESGDPWTCYLAHKSTKYCDQGVWPACDPAAWPEKRWGKIDWSIRTTIKPALLTPVWENLEAGRGLIRKSQAKWRPAPMPLAEIDETFGAACNGGVSYGCIEGANAAMNVQLEFRTPERIEHAVKSLKKGCELGNYQSCWFLATTVKMPMRQALKEARTACYMAPRGVQLYPELCQSYVDLRLEEAGYTPWLMDSTLNTEEAFSICREQKDPYLCNAVSEFMRFALVTGEPSQMPQNVAAWDGASIACMDHLNEGCERLVRIAQGWPVDPEESPQAVAQKICKAFPEYCERVNRPLH